MTAPDTAAIRGQMEALAGFTPGPWYSSNQPGDWGLGGVHHIHVAEADPYEWYQAIAHVEYQTPYCLGEKRSVIDAANAAASNARLIAAAPDMHATILALCNALESERAEVERIGRELNVAKYGQPDFAWSVHLEAMAELTAENNRLRKALEGVTERYLSLASSGDAGFWDPEVEPEVIAARAALAQKGGEA